MQFWRFKLLVSRMDFIDCYLGELLTVSLGIRFPYRYAHRLYSYHDAAVTAV